MKFDTWSLDWAHLASKTQQEMQFFVGRTQPTTIYQGKMAYVDPTCPCQPGHEEWAYIQSVSVGKTRQGDDCSLLHVTQPATFRVLFWYDPDGVSINEKIETAPRYWYQISIPFGHGCSWVYYPADDGEYLCSFEKRRIRVEKKIATIEQAKGKTLLEQIERTL